MAHGNMYHRVIERLALMEELKIQGLVHTQQFKETLSEVGQLLYQHLSIGDWMYLERLMGRSLSWEEKATVVQGIAEGEDAPAALGFGPELCWGFALQRARLSQGMSLDWVANRVDISESDLTAMEDGVMLPTPVQMQRLFDVFGGSARVLRPFARRHLSKYSG